MIVTAWSLLFAVLFVIYVLATSVYEIPANKMLASFFISTYQGAYVSGTFENQYGLIKDARRGNIPFFRDWLFLLWPFWRVRIFPLTNVVLKYHASRVYSQEGIPFRLDGTIVSELDPALARFVSEFDVLSEGTDLTRKEIVRFIYDKEPATGAITYHEYDGSCLAQTVLNDTTDAFHEACRRVAAQFPWDELVQKTHEFEEAMRLELAAPESRFAKAGMLLQYVDPVTGTTRGISGHSVRLDGFDINVEDVAPMNEDFTKALSQPEIGRKEGIGEAKRRAAIGIGEGKRMRAITRRTGLTSQELAYNESMREAEELNIIAAGDTLSAVVGGLIAGRKSPKSGTSGKKPIPTSPPPTTTP